MDLTVGSLKIGSKLVFGKYGVHNDDPQPIVWLKASPNCDFITEKVLDYLCFDAREENSESRFIRYNGNSCFLHSNLFQFLNSEKDIWYSPSHPADAPPTSRNVCGQFTHYENHYGFLYCFEEHEIESIDCTYVCNERIHSLIRLPSERDIFGAHRFSLFSKKGIRPNGTKDMLAHRNDGFTDESYIPFWIPEQEEEDEFVRTVHRSGRMTRVAPYDSRGVRPVCNIKPDTIIVPVDGDMFIVKPYAVSPNACTEAELLDFLGLARP